ncbi:hypothetical protein [Lacimicrobium sp. SS2-24]|uniref:hypothetical protein n=1 Tax=Lacimicrobium sp. SS2-24 TaxID=2005569 RepID=UPI000B4BA699|nr:hypothetical protein [Lacimicrobium sp. SS2-24]
MTAGDAERIHPTGLDAAKHHDWFIYRFTIAILYACNHIEVIHVIFIGAMIQASTPTSRLSHWLLFSLGIWASLLLADSVFDNSLTDDHHLVVQQDTQQSLYILAEDGADCDDANLCSFNNNLQPVPSAPLRCAVRSHRSSYHVLYHPRAPPQRLQS